MNKTESLQIQKSSLEPSSTADREIFSAHGLLEKHKSFMKTKSLQTQKSSLEPSSTADAESLAPIDYVRIKND